MNPPRPAHADLYDVASLTPRQRAVLDLWPEFQEVAAMRWTSLDQLVRVVSTAQSLGELSDEEADQVVAMLRTAITRLRLLAPISAARPMPRRPRHSRYVGSGRA